MLVPLLGFVFAVLSTVVAALSTGEHFFRGERCLSHYPDTVCPITSACIHGDNCVLWGTGVYHWHHEPYYDYQNYFNITNNNGDKKSVDTVQAYKYRLPNVTACNRTDIPGYWYYGQWRPQPDQGCVFHRFPRAEMRNCLRGKKIMFFGDSYLRQLKLRLIFYLRGLEGVAEHYWHRHSTYSYYESEYDNITAFDSLRVFGDISAKDTAPLERGESFRLNFYWAYTRGDFLADIKAYQPDVLILGGFVAATEHPARELRFAEDAMREGQATGKPSKVFVEPIPPGIWSDEDTKVTNSHRREKIAALRTMYPKVDAHILPMDDMTVGSPYSRNEIENPATHFQCGYMPEYNDGVSGITWIKTPANRDCRDLFNFELLMQMLNIMCPAT